MVIKNLFERRYFMRRTTAAGLSKAAKTYEVLETS
jgi:hypothetical protein